MTIWSVMIAYVGCYTIDWSLHVTCSSMPHNL